MPFGHLAVDTAGAAQIATGVPVSGEILRVQPAGGSRRASQPRVVWDDTDDSNTNGDVLCMILTMFFLLVMGLTLLIMMLSTTEGPVRLRIFILLLGLHIPIGVIIWWSSTAHKHVVDVCYMLRQYAAGYLAFLAVVFVQSIIILVLVTSLKFFTPIVLVLASFTCALPEESLKYRSATQRWKSGADSTTHLLGSVATSCGYGTFQCFIVVTLVVVILDYRWTISNVVVALLVADLILIPLHLVSGYIMGLKVAKVKEELAEQGVPANRASSDKRAGTCHAMVKPWLLRSAFYLQFSLLVYLAWNTWDVDTILLVGLAFGLGDLVGALLYARHLESKMPPAYLERVGYMHYGDYGTLPLVTGLVLDDPAEEGDGAEPLRRSSSQSRLVTASEASAGGAESAGEGPPREGPPPAEMYASLSAPQVGSPIRPSPRRLPAPDSP